MSDELYDAVKRAQKICPDLFTLLPFGIMVSEDPYEVIVGLAETAQEVLDKKLEDAIWYCDECGRDLVEHVTCQNCKQELTDKIYYLEKELDK